MDDKPYYASESDKNDSQGLSETINDYTSQTVTEPAIRNESGLHKHDQLLLLNILALTLSKGKPPA